MIVMFSGPGEREMSTRSYLQENELDRRLNVFKYVPFTEI